MELRNKFKKTKSIGTVHECCPRHVVFDEPATVLPLSLSFPSPSQATSKKSVNPTKQTRERKRNKKESFVSFRYRFSSNNNVMESEHVWRVGACSTNSSLHNQNNIFNGIMLRFRPIAPKPVTGSSSTSGELTPAKEFISTPLPGKRTKRKYVRIRRNNGYTKKNGNKPPEKVVETTENMDSVAAVVTLQLMPEKEEEETPISGDSWYKNVDLNLTVEKIQILETLNSNSNSKPDLETENAREILDLKSTTEKAVVESWITVESVTGTCMSEESERVLNCTDVEKMKILETDTCPCFVTDGYGRVLWVNDAYKRMVVNDEIKEIEVVVWLKVKESVAWCYSYPAFTCGVRLQYTWRKEKCLKMVPCDVWRLQCGGFAWRLDVKAALSLGL